MSAISVGATEMVEIKSKFELEFRRISVPRSEIERLSLESFYRLVADAHCLPRAAHVQISYQNPLSMKVSNLESAEELKTALKSAVPLLRLFVSRIRGIEVQVSGSDDDDDEETGDKNNGDSRDREDGGDVGIGGRGSGEERREKGRQVGKGRGKHNSPSLNLFHRAMNSLVSPTNRHNNGNYSNHHTAGEQPCLDCQSAHPQWENGDSMEGDGDKGQTHIPSTYGHHSNQMSNDGDILVGGMGKLSLEQNGDQMTYNPTPEQNFLFVIEIYGFAPSLSTRDILQEFDTYPPSELCIKWVDDTHALGIFASERQAWLACGAVYKRFRTRMVCDGSPQSISTAVRFANELRPQGSGGEGQRPKTTAMVARRMVSSALGIRVNLSKEQKEKERQELETARENRRLRS